MVGVTPDTLAELTDMMQELDTAVSFGSSWMTDERHMDVRAVRGNLFTVRLLDSRRAELLTIQRSRGLVQVAGWHGSGAGLALPPNMARKVWDLAETKKLAGRVR